MEAIQSIVPQALHYLLNCFILIVPVLIWNIFLEKSLPPRYSREIFWKDIPKPIALAENLLRMIVLITPVFMPLSIHTGLQKTGLALYAIGVIIYGMAWIMQIFFPEGQWSKSSYGSLAPAYTTIIWLAGIGLIGNSLFMNISYSPVMYIAVSSAFAIFHTLHACIIFVRSRKDT